ncbi:hypothetical protein ETB97_012173 [Aspergillus alliaceus]|uniref:Uncharacterized protein n=1 Tax=Petromyces alliaceus TaxID=209559 RepID=A0A8H6A5I8_PETAA|nr:hypothetical protein ETB97_012173 [Aspergillus burnettii]
MQAAFSRQPPYSLQPRFVTNNNPTASQTSEVNFRNSVAETPSFTLKSGFSLSVGACFSVGVTFIADGKVSTGFTAKKDFSWGQATTNTTTVGECISVTAPANLHSESDRQSQLLDNRCPMHPPSEIQVDNTVTTHSNVVHHGLSYWKFQATYD